MQCFLCQLHKGIRGSGGNAPFILYLALDAGLTSRPCRLPRRRGQADNLRIGRREHQNWSERFRKEKNHFLVPGFESRIAQPEWLTLAHVFLFKKVNQSHYRPGQAQRVPGSYGSQISWQRYRMVEGCQPYAPAAFTPQEILPVLISVRSCVDPRAIVRSEGFYVNEISTDTSWDRTSDLPICGTAP